MKTTKAGEQMQINLAQFPSIKGAYGNLDALKSVIEDVMHEMDSAKSEEGHIGWDDGDNFGEFVRCALSYDPEFMRKLVNLGSGL